MANKPYRTGPAVSTKMPGGIPYIIGNECAERFSFYGMKAILTIFITEHLVNRSGVLDTMSEVESKQWVHFFMMAVYFTPLLGGLVSDIYLGKYRTIISLSIVYVAGHIALAMDSTRIGLAIGLGLIAVGAGGIKSCVSAHVGDQFGSQNQHLVSKIFAWFYFAINFGAAISMVATPKLLELYGPHVAFGVPGILMFIATIVFWMGRHKFAHIPAGGPRFVKDALSKDGTRLMVKLCVIYLFVAVFWSLFDQTASSWVLQAKHMNLNLLGIEWLPAQLQAVNPILILTFIPLFTYVLYPMIDKVFALTPLRKIGIGLFLTVAPFVIGAWLEARIQNGEAPSIAWQIFQYVLMTAAEIMVSITALEFSYTQAPKRMKSWIMGLFFAGVSLGNALTWAVNVIIENDDGTTKLDGAAYYLFFAGMMFVAAVLFVFVAAKYKEERHVQDDEADEIHSEAQAEGTSGG